MTDEERRIENSVGEQLSRWAYEMGIELIYLKLSVLGQRGWPDRLILWKGEREEGHLMFVEFKRPGEAPRSLQKHIHKLIAKCGFDVRTYDDKSLALKEIKEAVLATTGTTKGPQITGF